MKLLSKEEVLNLPIGTIFVDFCGEEPNLDGNIYFTVRTEEEIYLNIRGSNLHWAYTDNYENKSALDQEVRWWRGKQRVLDEILKYPPYEITEEILNQWQDKLDYLFRILNLEACSYKREKVTLTMRMK